MKTIYTLLLSLSTLINSYANDIFIYKNDKNVVGEIVVNNELSEIMLSENTTHSLTNNLSIVTKKDQSMLYALSSKTFIKQDPDTSVYFNEFLIEFENDFKLPENLIVKKANANFSLSTGQLYLIQRAENVETTILTPLANLSFGEAKIFVKSSPEFTTVYVFDGVVYLFENRGNKMYQVANGTAVVVTPAPTIWGPRSPVGKNHNFTDTNLKDLDIGDETIVSDLFSDLQYSFDNTIFINYNKEVFGVKYKKRKTN